MILIADTIHDKLKEKLASLDQVIQVRNSIFYYNGIKNHPDVQVCRINDRLFTTEEFLINHPQIQQLKAMIITKINEQPGTSYPSTAMLNLITFKKTVICNTKYIAPEIRDYVSEEGFTIIHVNQGYTRCTTLPLTHNAFITDDPGIAKTLTRHNLSVLKVKPGFVDLHHHPYGFIGGSAGVINQTVYFNGDITKHPDFKAITDFCLQHNLDVDYIPEKPLQDIGSILQI